VHRGGGSSAQGGEGLVHRGGVRSAQGEKEKCTRGEGEVHKGAGAGRKDPPVTPLL
jgi:hypothetical protein